LEKKRDNKRKSHETGKRTPLSISGLKDAENEEGPRT